jgi:hypothetical protein
VKRYNKYSVSLPGLALMELLGRGTARAAVQQSKRRQSSAEKVQFRLEFWPLSGILKVSKPMGRLGFA